MKNVEIVRCICAIGIRIKEQKKEEKHFVVSHLVPLSCNMPYTTHCTLYSEQHQYTQYMGSVPQRTHIEFISVTGNDTTTKRQSDERQTTCIHSTHTAVRAYRCRTIQCFSMILNVELTQSNSVYERLRTRKVALICILAIQQQYRDYLHTKHTIRKTKISRKF